MDSETQLVTASTLSPSEAVAPGSLPTPPSAGGARWLRAVWPLYIVIGLLLGAYLGINDVLGGSRTLWRPFVREYSSVLIIFVLIPFVIRLENLFRLNARPRTPVMLVHTLGALLFSTIHVVVAYTLRIVVWRLAGETYFIGNVLFTFLYELQKDVITYVIVLLISFAVRESRVRRASELRTAHLTAELGKAQLRHLTAQVDPHFLFNALNAISNRMREDLDAADRMITQLGDLLRAAYDTDQHLLVPLAHELQWLRGYASMMAERFRGQLNFELEIAPTLENLKVPRLLLQPLIENSFRHGLAQGRGNLSVQVGCYGHCLRYTITDDGAGLPSTPITHGTGLSNVARRLELMFPGDHKFNLAPRFPRGTVVTVEFPVSA